MQSTVQVWNEGAGSSNMMKDSNTEGKHQTRIRNVRIGCGIKKQEENKEVRCNHVTMSDWWEES